MVSLSYHFIRAYHFRKCQFERCQSHFWCISLLRAVGAFYAEYQLEMNLLLMNVPRILWFAQYMTLTAGQSIMIVATDTENRMCFIILQEKQMHYVSTFHPLWEFSITGCVSIPKYDCERSNMHRALLQEFMLMICSWKKSELLGETSNLVMRTQSAENVSLEVHIHILNWWKNNMID